MRKKGGMVNLLTLDSDSELQEMKEFARNTKLISFDEIKHYEIQLDLEEKHEKFKSLLIFFDRFCRDNKIKYSLADGTLLGAYRHHHFIPWDDDADVMMTRGEYERFKKVIASADDLREFKILFCHRVSTKELYSEGIIIDIFVIDNIPKSRIRWELKKFFSRLLRVSCFNRMSIPNIKKKGVKGLVLYILFPVAFIMGRVERLFLGRHIFDINETIAYEKEESGYSTKYTSNWRELNRIFKKEWFDEYEDIKMNDYDFMTIKCAEDYLVNMFGNWKSIPEEAELKREHDHIPILLKDRFINGWYH